MDAASRASRRDDRRHRRTLPHDRRRCCARSTTLRGNTIRAGDYLMIPHATAVARELYAERRRARGATAEHAAQRRAARARRANRRDRSGRSRAPTTSMSARLASWNSMAPGDVLSVGRNARRVDEPAARRSRAARHGAGVAAHARIPPTGFVAATATAFARSPTSCAAATRCRRSHGASASRSRSSSSGTPAPQTSICSPGNASRCSSTCTEQSG